ncbi:MAG: CpsD/CapB family tyrosine-protein kinase [Rhodospirillales bacterium]|nr:CpsD/CapB family tyrosine-protein kinase [Alphaproteobacteria bacterium]USO04269.1 MAG: CpsD/CapB family tyrosine-protein kinase [Rhodospirillales bacterium]
MRQYKDDIQKKAAHLEKILAGTLGLDTSALEKEKTSLSAFEKALDQNRIIAHRTHSREADIFRFLRTQILQAMQKSGLKTLAITSPNYNDGKTTIAANLAVSISQDLKQTVLLADLDLRKPSLHNYLKLEQKFGLTDYLKGKASVQECLLRMPFERLSIFPAGQAVDKSSETLGSPEMKKLATELKTRYADRVIIYDMPPLLAQDDPLVFLPHVDAVLLVIKEGVTTTDEIKRCLDILSSAKVIGTVLNSVR